MNSVSGFDMFSIWCSELKVNFLKYWGWTVNSVVSVYVKFNILQNSIKNKNERSHFKPNFAIYKCMAIPPTVINAVKISMQNVVFTTKYAMSY